MSGIARFHGRDCYSSVSTIALFPEIVTISLTYIGSTTSTADASQYTFTDHDIGGPGLIVVAVFGESSGAGLGTDVSSATIGGVGAAIVATANSTAALAGTDAWVAIISAEVVAGTTATIVLNLDEAATRCDISVYRIQDYSSSTAVDSDIDASNGVNFSTTLSFGAGPTVAVLVQSSSANGAVIDWNAVAGGTVTDDRNVVIETSCTGAVSNVTGATGDQTVSSTGANTGMAYAIACWS